MKAWTVTAVGAPADVMELVDRDPPPATAGELLVRVRMAGVSLPEVLMCQGLYAYQPPLPFTPGHEVVGTVLDAGGVPDFEVGQRVMGVTNFGAGHGGHAEQALLHANSASPVPDSMPDEHAAVFTIAYTTAYISLVIRAGLRAGEALLVHGAAGGTGFAAVQLGKAVGARVIAVVRGDEKVEAARRDGADHVIDSARCPDGDWLPAVKEAAGRGRVDVVFDPVGGEVYQRSVECLAYGGRLLPIGFASGAWGEVPTWDLVSRNISVVGSIAVTPDEETARAMRRELAALYEKGSLQPRVAKIHPFDDVPRALTELYERRAIGKHVIRVSE